MVDRSRDLGVTINFILEDDSKATTKPLSVYENCIFFFIYHVRTTEPGKFLDLGVCDLSIFWSKTKIAVELQLYFCNFKKRG